MSQAPIPHDPLRSLGVDGAAQNAKPAAASAEGSAAFRALLDGLAQKAASLGEASQSLGKPEELASVVDDARQSLADAVSLSDQLLEAYRAKRLTEGGAGEVQ